MFWRILLFYVFAILVIGLLIPYTDPNLLKGQVTDIGVSPFTLVFQNAGIAFAASVMNAVILTAVLSAGNSGMYETWLFEAGALQLGVGAPKMPTEVQRQAQAGNGGGQEILYNRVEWCIHPMGHAYIGTAPNGGPSNAASSNNLNIAGSWNRVYSERKQIKFARLLTREA